MKYRNLGTTGLRVSIAGVGCNNFGGRCDEAQSAKVVHAALDQGINFFDTADVYGGQLSEVILGRAIAGRDRSQIVIATKYASPMGDGVMQRGASRQYIFSAVEASLRRLNTDYIDLYQQHVPDAKTPIEETLAALDDLVRQGKVRYLGNSNFSGWQIADADWTARHNGLQRFASAQNLYSLLERGVEHEVLPACERFGLGMLPFFPLASGLLTGKYVRGKDAPEGTRLANFGERGKRALSDANFDRVDRLSDYAGSHGKTVLELAMSWLASDPVVSSVIAGATKPEQVEANAAAVSWELDAGERDEIRELAA